MIERFFKKRSLAYIGELVFWTLVTAFPYHALAFRSIPTLTYSQSQAIYWCLLLSSLVLNFLITPKYARNTFTRYISVGSPFGLYFILSFFDLYSTLIIVILIATGIVLAFYVGLSLHVNAETLLRHFINGRWKRTPRHFWRCLLHRSRLIVCSGLSLLFVLFFIGVFLGFPLLDAHTVATVPQVNAQTITGNMETVLLLQEEEWAKLDIQQRLDVLQTVANIEATHLGLPHELNVVAKPLDQTVAGAYTDPTHTIFVNVDYLSEGSAHAFVKVIAHEAYHAYEHRLVDLYDNAEPQERNLLLFHRLETYKYNFSHYIDNQEDADAYAAQAIEIDSNTYGEEAVRDYYHAIEDFLNAA